MSHLDYFQKNSVRFPSFQIPAHARGTGGSTSTTVRKYGSTAFILRTILLLVPYIVKFSYNIVPYVPYGILRHGTIALHQKMTMAQKLSQKIDRYTDRHTETETESNETCRPTTTPIFTLLVVLVLVLVAPFRTDKLVRHLRPSQPRLHLVRLPLRVRLPLLMSRDNDRLRLLDRGRHTRARASPVDRDLPVQLPMVRQ